ncbi:MAG: PEGA domain-containing protein [Pirellulales bacterium]
MNATAIPSKGLNLRLGVIALALALPLSLTGCVRRRMTVRSNPPGAALWVDNQFIGTTPVSTSFVYYGTRKLMLQKDGYETMTVYRKIRPPWYQVPPLDFVSENMWPSELRDERLLNFEMRVQPPTSLEETLNKAQEFRRSVRQDAGLSLLSKERQMADSRSQLPADSPLRVASPLRRLPDPDDTSTWSRQAQDSEEVPPRR